MKRVLFPAIVLALLLQSCAQQTAQLSYEPFTGELRRSLNTKL